MRKANNTKAADGGPLRLLATKPQTLDELLVLLRLGGSEVIEELAALVHELHETAPRGVIALVGGEVLTESVDALGEKRHLNFGGTRVGGPAAELGEDAALFLAG